VRTTLRPCYVVDRFDEAFLQRPLHRGSTSAAPIFVIGMPRCGSSLIEQILSSHRHVQSMGENAALSTVLDRGITEAELAANWGDLAGSLSGLDAPTRFLEC